MTKLILKIIKMNTFEAKYGFIRAMTHLTCNTTV